MASFEVGSSWRREGAAERRWRGIALALLLATVGRAHAETIKIGVVKATPGAAIFIAKEKGYFAAENLSAEIKFLAGGQPIAVAVAAGDIDFGVAALTAGFYSLAGQGALRIIAASNREAPGFHDQALVASRTAFAAGLTAPKQLRGHAFAVTQIGSPPHYAVALLAQKYGFDLRSLRLVPLQSIPNQVSAVIGGKADAAMLPSAAALPLFARGDMKRLAWIDDEVSWQFAAAFTSAKLANNKRALVERFLAAYRRAMRDYHDAFTGPGEKRQDGPMAAEIERLIARSIDRPVADVANSVAYADAEARLDVADVRRQIAWYKAQGMLKPSIDSAALIDRRYVVALHGK